MSLNSVWKHTRDRQTNQTIALRSSDSVNPRYDYRPNWAPLGPITSTNSAGMHDNISFTPVFETSTDNNVSLNNRTPFCDMFYLHCVKQFPGFQQARVFMFVLGFFVVLAN